MQAEAILKMTLGQLVNLEQEKLVDEYTKLLEEIDEYLRILGDEARIFAMIRDDCEEIARNTPIPAAPRSAAKKSATSISKT